MAEKKYKRTWRPASKGSEGPKKSMPNRKTPVSALRKKYGLSAPGRKSAADRLKKAGQKSMESRTKAPTKPPMGSKRRTPADVAKDRKRQVVAKKAGPTKRRVAGEPPNRSMASKARSVRAGRVRDSKVGRMNSNIKKMQGPRPY